jgi:DegT/DnrJ/EryC1/StrS aminotransferase family
MSAVLLEREIVAFMADRLQRRCLFVPSGRLALYIALRAWFSPGDRILMSASTDDIILFVVLAAGLRPVIAPVSVDDGNIDPAAVSEEVWSSIAGVLTTNLYGLPDRMAELQSRCGTHGITVIEDAAHAIETEVDGQRIGTFGEAAAFSFSKHVAASSGGMLAVRDGARLAELERLRDDVLSPRSSTRTVIDLAVPAMKQLFRALRLAGPGLRIYRSLGLDGRPRYRLTLDGALLAEAMAGGQTGSGAGADLDRFERWVRVDRGGYRCPLHPLALRRILDRLSTLSVDRSRRIRGVDQLRELDVVAPAVRAGSPQPLFRVPLLVADRDKVRTALERRGIVVGYIYDPPLDDYVGVSFVEPSPLPAPARWFAAHVLPVDPLQAPRILDVLAGLGGVRTPAHFPYERGGLTTG